MKTHYAFESNDLTVLLDLTPLRPNDRAGVRDLDQNYSDARGVNPTATAAQART